MATISTPRWVSTSPYVQLIVNVTNAATAATLTWTLNYIASSAANTSNAKSYSVTINGSTVKTGTYSIDGKSGTNQIATGTVTITKTKSTQNIAIGCSMAFNLTWSGSYAGTKSASGSVAVGAKSSYTITYNANNGTGAPSSQTKWHGEDIALSTTKPTRTGYTFKGWGIEPSGGVSYSSGAKYTDNKNLTLYAIWQIKTYTVTYNANGGVDAPASQTKNHGQALTLSTKKPTRTNYTFKGWANTATGNVAYQSGSNYTGNASITLYAVWELIYFLPKIYNVTVDWSTTHEPETDANGIVRQYAVGGFDWETSYADPNIHVGFYTSDGTLIANKSWTISGGKTHNDYGLETFPSELFLLNFDVSYTVKITIEDSGGEATVTTTLGGNIYPIDVLAGGNGVSFGGPASIRGTAHFQWAAKFDKPVYGKALGMDKLPAIPSNSDLNSYMEPGCYAVQSNAIAETCANIPVARAGRLEVWSSTGEGIRTEQWSYLRQRFIPYNSANAVWEREITRSADNVWRFYDWWQSSLTPVAAEKVYSKAAMTISLNANESLGVVNTYTQIPLTKTLASTSDRLTMQSSSIRIGANIDYVKVSGQALIKCGSTANNRHVRIQKVSGGTTTSVAWACVYATASSNTIFPFAPMIVPVAEGDLIRMVFYTSDSADSNQSGSSANGWQTYLTVEEI